MFLKHKNKQAKFSMKCIYYVLCIIEEFTRNANKFIILSLKCKVFNLKIIYLYFMFKTNKLKRIKK